MSNIKVKIKKLAPNAVIPKYAKPSDAGMDLVVTSKEVSEVDGQIIYGFGLAFEIPDKHVGLIFPRSSVFKQDITLSNCVGVIDSGYRGEVKAVFNFTPVGQQLFESRRDNELRVYDIGERACQMIILPYPMVELEEVTELSDSARGSGGFGSTGA